MLKILGSEAVRSAALVGVEALGARGLVADTALVPGIVDPTDVMTVNPWPHAYLRSFVSTIAGGTSEIQRNIVAEQILGLPR
jgi:alkylation response protein AidB-like acyl-CoA dehydrogenase